MFDKYILNVFVNSAQSIFDCAVSIFEREKMPEVKPKSDENDLGGVLDVFPVCPYHHQQISSKNGSHKAHHYWIISKCSKEFGSAGNVHQVGHDKEGAAEEC